MPETCGRTSATRYPTVRPGSSSTMPTLRVARVITPTSGGPCGPAGAFAPLQPKSAFAKATTAIQVPLRTTFEFLLLSLFAAVLEHAPQEVRESGDLFVAEAAQVALELRIDERLYLVARAPALV